MSQRSRVFARAIAIGAASLVAPTPAVADLPPNPSACPAHAPSPGATCTPIPHACLYPGTSAWASVSCVCATDVQPPVWRCAARIVRPVRGPLAPPELATEQV